MSGSADGPDDLSGITQRACADIAARTAPAEHFSGTVQMEPLSKRDGFDCETLRVTFAPGGRTGWHTHPVGQILIVTAGCGIIATRSGSRRMSSGDVIEIPADVEHWHGATDETLMQHIAIQPGGATRWQALVSDADYATGIEMALQ